MCREDGAHRHLLCEQPGLLGSGTQVQGASGGAREQAALGSAASPDVARTLDLLCDVGEVEVDGEGTCNQGRLVQVEAVDDVGGFGGVVPDGSADALDGLEEFRATVLGE